MILQIKNPADNCDRSESSFSSINRLANGGLVTSGEKSISKAFYRLLEWVFIFEFGCNNPDSGNYFQL
jgi:hypothetical protein